MPNNDPRAAKLIPMDIEVMGWKAIFILLGKKGLIIVVKSKPEPPKVNPMEIPYSPINNPISPRNGPSTITILKNIRAIMVKIVFSPLLLEVNKITSRFL